MKKKMAREPHWTMSSIEDYVYFVSTAFVAQLKDKLQQSPRMSQKSYAEEMELSPGRISQMLKNPGNLSLSTMIYLVEGLKMKISIVAYDDGDKDHLLPPIHPEVFVDCWKKAGCPHELNISRAPKRKIKNKANQ